VVAPVKKASGSVDQENESKRNVDAENKKQFIVESEQEEDEDDDEVGEDEFVLPANSHSGGLTNHTDMLSRELQII
jgi:hypothetical protein